MQELTVSQIYPAKTGCCIHLMHLKLQEKNQRIEKTEIQQAKKNFCLKAFQCFPVFGSFYT